MARRPRVKPGSQSATSLPAQEGVIKAEAEKIELLGRRSFYKSRNVWSSWIIAWICVLILFNIALTVLVGANVLRFLEYKWFVTSVTAETFLQIVGLGYIAVKYFFKDPKKP